MIHFKLFFIISSLIGLSFADLATHFRPKYSQYQLPTNVSKNDLVNQILPESIFKFVLLGVSKIVWDHMPTIVDSNQIGLSSPCLQSLNETLVALETGRKWAFESKWLYS